MDWSDRRNESAHQESQDQLDSASEFLLRSAFQFQPGSPPQRPHVDFLQGRHENLLQDQHDGPPQEQDYDQPLNRRQFPPGSIHPIVISKLSTNGASQSILTSRPVNPPITPSLSPERTADGETDVGTTGHHNSSRSSSPIFYMEQHPNEGVGDNYYTPMFGAFSTSNAVRGPVNQKGEPFDLAKMLDRLQEEKTDWDGRGRAFRREHIDARPRARSLP